MQGIDLDRTSRPDRLVTVGLTLLLLTGELFTYASFGLGCGLGEGQAAVWDRFCDSPLPASPVVGSIALLLGAVLSHGLRRYTPWIAGAAVATLTGLMPWIAMGDPAGNFGGILA